MAAPDSAELLHDYSPFLKHYKDGRIEKLMGLDLVPASLDPQTGVLSKDVVISTDINLTARIFRPKSAAPGHTLPLLVFFHGGGFVIESAFSPIYTRYLNLLVAEANVIAVSVNYRLAPENPLPIAYEDSWIALKWVISQSKTGGNENPNSDEWIRDFADFSRVYLGGDSAGGNIAHNIAIRVASENLGGFSFRGLILNSPYFWGESPIGREAEYYKLPINIRANVLWRYVCPVSPGCDDPLINPAMDPNLSSLGCRKVLVYVGREDFLRDRGLHYKEVLEKSGWDGDVEVVDVEGENHVFDVVNPTGENSIAMIKKVESAVSPSYHNHMSSLVAKANVVVVSVDYRLAPEHPLPIGYEDSWTTLNGTI